MEDYTKIISIQKNKVLIILRDIINKYINLYNSIIDIYNKKSISINDKKIKKNIEDILSTIENKYKFREKINNALEQLENGYDNIKKSVRTYSILEKNNNIIELKYINIYSISRILFNIILIKLTGLILDIKEIINNIKKIIPSELLIDIKPNILENFNEQLRILFEYDREYLMKRYNEYYTKSQIKESNAIIYFYYCRLNKIIKTLFIKVLTGDFIHLNIVKLWKIDIDNLNLNQLSPKVKKCIYRLKDKIDKLIDKIDKNRKIDCGIDNIIQYIIPCVYNIIKIDTIDNLSLELNNKSSTNTNNTSVSISNNDINAIIIYNSNRDVFIDYKDITMPEINKLEYKDYKYLIHSKFNSKNISKGKIKLVKDSLINIKEQFSKINQKGITETNNTLKSIFDIYQNSNNRKQHKNIEFLPSSKNESFVLLFHIKDNIFGLIGDKNNNKIFNKLSDVPGIIHIFDILKLTITTESINKMEEKYDSNGIIKEKKRLFENEINKLNEINNKYIYGLNSILDENKYHYNLFEFDFDKSRLQLKNILSDDDIFSNLWFDINKLSEFKNINQLDENDKIKFYEIKMELLDKIILIYNKKMKNILNNNYVQYYKLQKFIPILNKDIVSQTLLYIGPYQTSIDKREKFIIYNQYIIDKLIIQKIIIDKIKKNNIMEKYVVKVISNIINECIKNIKILNSIELN